MLPCDALGRLIFHFSKFSHRSNSVGIPLHWAKQCLRNPSTILWDGSWTVIRIGIKEVWKTKKETDNSKLAVRFLFVSTYVCSAKAAFLSVICHLPHRIASSRKWLSFNPQVTWQMQQDNLSGSMVSKHDPAMPCFPGVKGAHCGLQSQAQHPKVLIPNRSLKWSLSWSSS